MTNFEHYEQNIKDFLLEHGHTTFAVIDKAFVVCDYNVPCAKCKLFGTIEHGNYCNRKKWLNTEYNPYSIPADTQVDTKVLVSNDGEEWFKRHFSHFFQGDPKPYVCFESGSSSWNARGFYHWQYCKLWEGDTTHVNERGEII